MKTALFVIDMQNDVVKKLGDAAKVVIPSIKRVIDYCRGHNIPVIYIVREHRESGIDIEKFRLNAFKEKPYVIEGSEGAKVIDALAPMPTELCIPKRRFSGFFQTELLMILTRLGIERVVLTGVQTPNCVRATAVDAIGYDFDVTILEDATAAQTVDVHKANLFDLANMGVQLKKVSEFTG